MLRSIFTKTLRDQRRSLLWWGVGLVWVVLLYVGGYRSYADSGLLSQQMPSAVTTMMGTSDFASAAGYVSGIVYTLLGSLLVMLAASFAGARSIAGEEEDGMLDVFLGHPVSRIRFVLERAGALAVTTAWFGLVVGVAVAVAAGMNDMGLSLVNIAAASTGLALLGLVIGMLALATGALTGSRALALGVAAAVGLTSYLLNALYPLFGDLDWLGKLSPHYHYLSGRPLTEGFDWGGLAVLGAVAVILVLIAMWGLQRRDVAA